MNKKRSQEQEDDSDKVIIYENPVSVTVYDVYFPESVPSSSKDYIKFLNLLAKSTESDTFKIRIASFGGDCHLGFRLCQAIRDSRARVIMVTEGPCYSMGSILALAGDELEITDGSFLMFHNYSGEYSGKGNELVLGIANWEQYFKDRMKYFCYPFLDNDELELLYLDHDLHIKPSDRDIKKRIKRHFGSK